MVRLMGAVLVAAGCAWVGFQVSEGMRRRVAELRELARGLALVERELELWAPPLPQLMERAAAHSRGAAQRLFRACYQGLDRLDREDFPTLWRRLVEEERSWRGEERELLAPLGELLGRYDGPAQRDGWPPSGRGWRSWRTGPRRTAAGRAGSTGPWACPAGPFW